MYEGKRCSDECSVPIDVTSHDHANRGESRADRKAEEGGALRAIEALEGATIATANPQ